MYQLVIYFTKTPTVHVHRTEPVQIRESTSIEGKEVNDLNCQGRKPTLFRKEAEHTRTQNGTSTDSRIYQYRRQRSQRSELSRKETYFVSQGSRAVRKGY
uniref:Uncharacterized protein n=1 Tax=Wuchereria bancrofti TaxID=6293 RepID=A0AAF5Q6H3_WUCBA